MFTTNDLKVFKKFGIVNINGDGGTRMEAKRDKLDANSLCPNFNTWRTIWVRLKLMICIWVDCLVDIFRLVYNNTTHTTHPPPGVRIRIPNFGDTDTVEWLSHLQYSIVKYYSSLVKNLVSWGYQKNKSVRGAPFDFRKAPNELGEYYGNLTRLIEETYSMNNNTKVVIIAHSLGNLVILYYLNHKSQQWKDKYIRSFITMAAPWGGSVKAMKMIASGDDLDVITVPRLKVRIVQRSMPSSAFLMPSPLFWKKTEVLVQTPKRNYTVDSYKQFFSDLKFNDGYLMREDTEDLLDPRKPPNAEVHCLYGYALKTAGRYVYGSGQFPDKTPKPINQDGDRTVSLRSLEGCLTWKQSQKQPFYSKSFQKVDHMGIIKHSVVISYIRSILVG